MKNNIYVLYNTLSKRYGEVFAAASDGMAEKNTRLALTHSGQDLKDLELCRIGAIDIETAEVETQAAIRIAWNEENNMPVRETKQA